MRAQTLCYPEKIWPDVIKELARVAKVNGMVEIFDTTLTVRDGGPSFTTLINEWLATALRMRYIDTTVTARLEPMFVSAGIGPVTHLSAQWPLGWDPTNTQYTKMSKEMSFRCCRASNRRYWPPWGLPTKNTPNTLITWNWSSASTNRILTSSSTTEGKTTPRNRPRTCTVWLSEPSHP
ncbi:hypothetical protein BC936DRAFT_146917 [Jimgerdemannia flammicorona]|uniref:Uncharacterized protein n=1 Tax=Jimgerdemannia flammicorona TaxID=994334 RepID=A0A433DNE3_9FUNG|nr:hypothetical protein BC936DRAFT_146917 [Jimgerdemannia flammicorona]